jgi:hypothetical protein
VKCASVGLRFPLAVFTVSFFVVGCWGPSNVGGVSGKVTLGGQPLPNALITFSPTAEGGSSGVGQTDSEGNYTLSYAAGVRGAQEGENVVRITTYREADPDAEPPQAAVPEKVPAKYNSKSELKVEVKSGSNTFDFPLEPGPVVQPGDQPAGGKGKRRDPDDC